MTIPLYTAIAIIQTNFITHTVWSIVEENVLIMNTSEFYHHPTEESKHSLTVHPGPGYNSFVPLVKCFTSI